MIFFLILIFLAPLPVFSRAGGGCFLPDTFILKSDGSSVKISQLKKGDNLLSFDRKGNLKTSKVLSIIKLEADEYFEIKTKNISVYATKEHPFYTGNGVFKIVESLKIGDEIYIFNGKEFSTEKIEAIKKIKNKIDVYNLKVSQPNTFFANYVAVHNKGGGCFPKGTTVKTPDGDKKIEEIKKGDWVLSFNGKTIVKSKVVEIHRTFDKILIIETESQTLKTTPSHPLLTEDGFKSAEDINENQKIAFYDNGAIKYTRIKKITSTEKLSMVYNLSVSYPNTFIADGFIVHNKGRFGGYRSRYYSSGRYKKKHPVSDMINDTIYVVLIILLIIQVISGNIGSSKKIKQTTFEKIYDRDDIELKRKTTETLIQKIAEKDKSFDLNYLKKRVSEVFIKAQLCWQNRNYAPVENDLTKNLYIQHTSQIEIMKNNHEINMMEDLEIISVDIVSVYYTVKENDRRFTALITAKAKDYYIDETTGEFLRGNNEPQVFQELWTFRFVNGKWLCEKITQTAEVDITTLEDFIENASISNTNNITYSIGSPLPQEEKNYIPLEKQQILMQKSALYQYINSLEVKNRIWNAGIMEITATLSFINIFSAFSLLDDNKLSDEYISKEFKKKIVMLINDKKISGYIYEIKNLCVRKAEIVLVNTLEKNGKDEFVARISAHLQEKVIHKDNIIYQDNDLKMFDEYFLFEIEQGRWKLTKVLSKEIWEDVTSSNQPSSFVIDSIKSLL